MTRKEDEEVGFQAPTNPHHILTDCDVSWISTISARRVGGQIVGQFSVVATYPEIYQDLLTRGGPGAYELTGKDANGQRLPGAVRIDVSEDTRAKIVMSQREADEPKGKITDTATQLLIEQNKRIAEAEKQLHEEQAALAKDRFLQQQEILKTREEAQTAAATAREKAQEDSLKMVMGFLERQTAAERELRQEQDRIRQEADLRERERERQAEEQARQFEAIRQKSMAEVERARADIEKQRIAALQEEMVRKIDEERRFNELRISQIQAQAQQEMAVAKRMVELELEQKRQELERKYGFVGDDSVPKSILEELWQRRLDKEYPEESDLDRIMHKYVEPLLGLIQSGKIQLPGVQSSGNVRGAVGALPAGAPSGNDQPGAVELDEYADVDDGEDGPGEEDEPEDIGVVSLPRSGFAS